LPPRDGSIRAPVNSRSQGRSREPRGNGDGLQDAVFLPAHAFALYSLPKVLNRELGPPLLM
jgi:hypothetical protein